MRSFFDTLVKAVDRLVLAVFFRQVEVLGEERVPAKGPVVLVANHVNGLIDPMLVLGPLPRVPRFLGKSTLWKIWPLRPLLALAGVIPVYRRHDPGVDTSKNLETFARCYEELARGGAISIFPEGISHSAPALQPLRTGAARIVLGAEARFGPLAARVVPVGLIYEAKDRFRSRALVQVADPIDPSPEIALYDEDPREAVRRLTERIESALETVTLNYASWEEARLIARAAELYDRRASDLPRSRNLAREFSVRRAFLEGYPIARERFPKRVEAVEKAVDAYDRLLRAFGLRDAQLVASYAPRPVLRFLWRALILLFIRLPLALVGLVLNWVPYRLAGLTARRVRHQPDQLATYKVFPALVLYPLFWLAAAYLARRLASLVPGSVEGGWAAAAILSIAPLSGWVALRFFEQQSHLAAEIRAFLLVGSRGRLARTLRRERGAVFEALSELVELYQEPPFNPDRELTAARAPERTQP